MAATMPTEALFDVNLMTSLLMAQLDLDNIDELDILTADETTLGGDSRAKNLHCEFSHGISRTCCRRSRIAGF
jgi:hypothetical protein